MLKHKKKCGTSWCCKKCNKWFLLSLEKKNYNEYLAIYDKPFPSDDFHKYHKCNFCWCRHCKKYVDFGVGILDCKRHTCYIPKPILKPINNNMIFLDFEAECIHTHKMNLVVDFLLKMYI